MSNDIIIRDQSRHCWRRFRNPLRILQAKRLYDVMPTLLQVEKAVQREGVYAAGFVSYEAGPAFDPALSAYRTNSFPLVWFGLYKYSSLFRIPKNHQSGSKALSWKSTVSAIEYEKAIRRIKRHIGLGDCYQVNYTFRQRTNFSGNPRALFINLAQQDDAPYGAFLDTKDWALVSTSPELFFSLKGNKIKSRPMKGTTRRGFSNKEDELLAQALQDSPKERAENIMIVDMVRNDLGKIAVPGSVHVPERFTLEMYPTLWQMTSLVEARTKAGFSSILRALFPPASVTGAPKPRVTEIISSLESEPRHIYTGTIGFLAPNREAQFNVAIRTVAIDKKKGRAEYGVGSGVVWDSLGKSEYVECRLKAEILTKSTPQFSLLETLLWTPGRGYFLLAGHLHRMKDSALYFDFTFDGARVRRALQVRASRFHQIPQRVRVLLTKEGKITIENSSLAGHRPDVRKIAFARRPIQSSDVFLYHKSTNRGIYDERLREKTAVDDVLLWNEKGDITESCFANVAVKIRGRLFTPPVSSGLLAGTYRARLLKQGKLTERVIKKTELARVSEVYLLNSVRGLEKAILVH